VDKPKVIIGLPTRGADIHPELMMWILNTRMLHQEYNVAYARCGASAIMGVKELLNVVTPKMLNEEYTHYLQLDTDILPPLNALDIMLAKDKDIVCAPIWHYDDITKEIHINVHYKGDKYRRHLLGHHGIEEIDASSFGFTLISKHVFQVFNEAKEDFITMSPLIKEEETRGVHNDCIFFAKIHKLGLKAYVDWDVKDIIHARKIDLCSEVLNKFIYAIARGDNFENTTIRK
jgi:hypothetical protein